ncbi:2OG-Fe(II) oxygenase [Aspergillus saccharolyticus JOP 1030-1]|uniref:Fe2OG dioxygenase domain-containing protein n=1 Tax=Aspergillus saccharolyticus JOP 1030-1 TaxID=1450539 RepID=A0A319ACP8_9EURO|nr:hypothetical protein BP01DRAFT_392329 [Aspergillus saccharolyticus JOP 1030-1]PYH44662.1 hypothetical protein BP01DRAFT_392329 [Aspergillus saccharolyticus JOP 1030-1]
MTSDTCSSSGESIMSDLPSEMLAALDGIETTAAFSSFGKFPVVDPGIHVADIGHIYLPLNRSQAQQLITKAHQAPYGKGSETLVDTSVRNTWELNSDQFELRRPDWNAHLREIAARVARDLGIESRISVELYKMLLYEKGAMFKPHTDTEKAPGMVATLVIGLPSAHEGGEVVVKHRGLTQSFKLSSTQCSYASWYSDVVHEVLPVTSGYRWVLTYNITLDGAQTHRPTRLARPDALCLYKTIKHWAEQDGEPSDHFWYKLDHEYTQASISLKALKTRDLACVQTLDEISTKVPVDIFLAVLEKQEIGSCAYDTYDSGHHGYHPFEELIDASYEVKSLVDLDGNQVLKGRRLDPSEILQADCFEDLPIAEEYYQGYQGNWGPEATHWYRVTAVAIVARHSTPSFLLGSLAKVVNPIMGPAWGRDDQKTISWVVDYYAKRIIDSDSDTSLLQSFKELMSMIWNMDVKTPEPRRAPFLGEDTTMQVLKAAVRTRDGAFFKECAQRHHGKLSEGFFTWAQEQLASGQITLTEVQDGLRAAVFAYPLFRTRYAAVARLLPLNNPMPDEVRRWVHEMNDQLLDPQGQQQLEYQDGVFLVLIARGYYGASYALTRISTFINHTRQNPCFVIGVLSRMHEDVKSGHLPEAAGMAIFQSTAHKLLSRLNSSSFNLTESPPRPTRRPDTVEARYRRRYESSRPAEPEPANPAIFGPHFASFARALIDYEGEDNLIDRLWQGIISSATSISAPTFQALWLPFLHAMIPFYTDNPEHPSRPRFHQVIATLLKAYITTYVGPRPVEDPSNVRPQQVTCFLRERGGCNLCPQLNTFLRDPTRTEWKWSLFSSERAHIHQVLDMGGVACTHVTDRSVFSNSSYQGLVLTKTFPHAAQTQRAWAQRKAEAGRKLHEFRPADLRAALGPKYWDIVEMRCLETPGRQAVGQGVEGTTSATTARSHPQRQDRYAGSSSSVLRKKRSAAEAEIVDLTGDY